ncbi:MAG: hypothetical protein JWM47_944 [Acidimicrobiales bacterium]|nr:hypothetical protein [Acidimicrobiales bacterium]
MIVQLSFILRRRWPVLAALLVAGAAAGVLIGPPSGSNHPGYVSTATISADQAGANQTEIQQDLVEAREGDVARSVAKDPRLGVTPEAVAARVRAKFDPETFVAKIAVPGPTPAAAQGLASAFSARFIEAGNGGASASQARAIATATTERQAAKDALEAFLSTNAAALATPSPPQVLASEKASLEADYDSAEQALHEMRGALRTTDIYSVVNVSAARAEAPSKLQVLDSTGFRALLGILLGLGGAALVISLAERTNPRIDDAAEAAELVGAPVLALVPVLERRRRHMITRVDRGNFKGPYAEAFRTMRAHLDFRGIVEELDVPPRIMVTSATPSEGKSTTAAFLALSYAETNTAPLIISGDLRRPTIHRLFGVARSPGLTTRARPGTPEVDLPGIILRDPLSGVMVVPSGPSVNQVNGVIDDLTTIAEVAQAAGQVVILDTAPVRVANDAVEFLAAVDWVVVVVQAGRSTKRSVTQMMQALRLNGAEVVGVVMVGASESADASRDYYSYYGPGDRDRRRARGDRRQRDRSVGVS